MYSEQSVKCPKCGETIKTRKRDYFKHCGKRYKISKHLTDGDVNEEIVTDVESVTEKSPLQKVQRKIVSKAPKKVQEAVDTTEKIQHKGRKLGIDYIKPDFVWKD